MTKRLSAGVLLTAFAVLLTAASAFAENPRAREWRGKEDASGSLPLFFRSAAGTTWINVGQGCAPEDTSESTHSPSQVWCFEGAGGANTWPSRGTQGSNAGYPAGTDAFGHWSKFAPPIAPASKWFVTNRNVGVGGGSRAAWCACDSAGVNSGCTDLAFWIFKEGYGDDWNYALTLDIPGANQSDTSFVKFDIRYDSECNYDYTYLEYLNDTTGEWTLAADASGRPARFNAVSGNKDLAHGGTGRVCGDDYFFHSDQFPGTTPYYGNSTWVTGVTFPIPPQPGAPALQVRWRCFSDGAWSDSDGSGDTDGIASIDNVKVTFKAAAADSVRDTFESNAQGLTFNAPTGFGSLVGVASWIPGQLEGNTYDGWHLEFDPKYKNKGNTCTFSNDWMWSSKPATAPIPANGFSYFLATPKIASNGWTGGVIEFSAYQCAPDNLNDYTNTHMRFYNSSTHSWSLWNDFDGFITFAGCDFWNMNDFETLTPFLGAEVDSIQMAFEMLDTDAPGDFQWGFHGSVTYLIDNVSIGSFDGSATVFAFGTSGLFSDTFSRVDPSHTANMPNSSEGNWVGNGGTAQLAAGDSISCQIDDVDGVTAANVRMYWRVGTGTPPTFGTWNNKGMVLSAPSATSTTDEGIYRTVIGNTTTEDFSANEAGSLGNPAKDPIWNAGQTVEYYIRVTDNAANVAVAPGQADDTPTPQFYRFQILPFNRTVGSSRKVLLVDDYTRNNLDFQHSTGFQATGGAGFGNFTSPVNDQPEDMVERALMLMYGGSEDLVDGIYGTPKWDIYNVNGAGSSVQREPRIVSQVAQGLGGVANDFGVPNYDAVIWLNGTFDAYSYADTTRIQLKSFLDNGGHLFSSGDDVAFFLGAGGNNADSTIHFIDEYLGTLFPTSTDDETADRVGNIVGNGGTSLAGVTVGLYGECPGIRKTFDKLTINPNSPGRTASVLATYQAVGADNGRAAIIKNTRTGGGGVAVHCGFGVESLVSDMARACILNKVFTVDFGLPATSFTGCINSGTDAPVVANSRFGFDLAQASPNPFSENTSIRFSVPNRTHVSIEVYNILGQKVRTLVDETMEGNSYVRDWDGRGDTGARVSSGIYFYKMVAGDYSATRKAVMLK